MPVDGSDEVRLRPERFIAGGEAMAHDTDGRVVFVGGVVPGDEVDATVVERKSGWSRAVVTNVVGPGPDRVEPPCPQRRIGCGGCDWQHLAVPSQLPAKVDIVRDAFRRTGHLPDATISGGRAIPPDGYRTTIRVVGDADGRPAYRVERSHDTVAATGCLVAHPRLRDLLDSVKVSPGLEVMMRVSAATGERTARWDTRSGGAVEVPDDVATGSRAAINEQVAGHRFRVSTGSFFQSGPAAAEALVTAVGAAAPELESAGCVVDAYSGVGLFAVASVPSSAHVITIESSRSAVSDARTNLAGRDADIVMGQFGVWRPSDGRSVDIVIADPARSGLAKPGVAAVVGAAAPVVVLVSCDPVAAARDAALLVSHGYRHDGTEVLDLFPHTHHVECVTRFVRAD
jgi:23S rRNA (uracil1939-C5)-methyltransferase